MSRPLRLVQQAAQPVEFCCPLCGSEHAAYTFGTAQFRIFRCGGCALTFSKSLPRPSEPASPAQSASAPASRDQRQHASLLASLAAAGIKSPVLLLADPNDGLIPLLEQRGMTIGRVIGAESAQSADWGGTYQAAIVSDALMRVSDPRATLLKVRQHLDPGAPLFLSLPLLDGRQARLMGRSWHEWQPANHWYFTRETLSLLLLAANFQHVWFRPERRRYSLDNLTERMQANAEATLWVRSLQFVQRWLPHPLRQSEFRLPRGPPSSVPRPHRCAPNASCRLWFRCSTKAGHSAT